MTSFAVTPLRTLSYTPSMRERNWTGWRLLFLWHVLFLHLLMTKKLYPYQYN